MLLETVKFKSRSGRAISGSYHDGANNTGFIFCHGLAADSRDFGDFPAELSRQGFKILAFDFEGHGGSDGERLLLTPEIVKDNIKKAIELIGEKKAEKIFLIGHSLGAYAALTGLKEPATAGAILVCPSKKSGDNLSFFKKNGIMIAGLFFKFFHALFKKDYYLFLKNGNKINARYLAYAAKFDNIKIAAQAGKPILVVASAKDEDVRIEKIRSLYEKIPDRRKKMLVLENSGHNPFSGPDKEILINAVTEFARENS